MAQIVDIIGVGPVEFPDGMSKEQMAEALKKLPKPEQTTPPSQPVQQETAPVTAAPAPAQPQGFNVLEASQAALARQQTKREADKTAAKTETIPFEQLYTNPENLKKIQDYSSLRFGKTGQPQPGESAADYVDRFARHMRFINTNELNYFPEQNWINNSKPADVLKAGEAYALFDKTAGFLSKGGQNPLKAVSDYIAGVGSAPSTVASLGVGKVVTGPLMRKAMQEGLKKAVASKVGAVGIGAPLATETSTNVLQNVYSQKRELSVADAAVKEMRTLLPQLSEEQQQQVLPQIEQIEKQVAEGIDVGEAALVGAVTAPISLAVEVGPLALAAKASTKFLKGEDFTLSEILDARKKQMGIAKKPDTLTGDKDADNIAVTTTDIYDGGDLLDAQGAPTAIAQMQVKNSLDKQADLIAASIWKQIPDTAPKPGEQTFEAVQRTLNSFDSLPDNVIKQSLEDAGTDLPNFLARLEAGGLDTDALEKFSAMYGVSTSDAARTLQSKSVISRMLNKMREVDPEAAKAVDALMGKKDPVVGSLGTLKGYVDRVDRNMITGMTVNMATVMRNAFGSGANVTFGAAERGLESMLFNTGRKLAGQMRGKPVTGDIGRGIYGAIDDTVDTWFYLGQQGLSKDITEEALKNNPMLMSKMLATAEDGRKTDLIAPIRILNTPAVLMDTFIRRAVFASSIDYHMKQVGLDLFDTMAQGKNIPIDVLRKGVDDALEFTFSKTPTDKLGKGFVDIVEAGRPLTTVVFPFARFLVNATKWTWKHYNPGLTAGAGAADMIRGVSMLRNGDEAGQALLMQGSTRIAQQATGAATLLAAYKYREENQDTPWNIMKSDDGTTVDTKYLFPLNVPLALADFYYKTLNGNPEDFKTKELVEALTGFKAVGTQGQMLDLAREATASIASGFTGDESDEAALNKMTKDSAEFLGAWLGRGTVPLNQFSDLLSAFDRDEGMQRDIFVTEPGEKLDAGDIVGRSIQKGIPILKQALPEYQPATREKAAPRDTGPFKQMTGLALIAPKNEIETEIERLNIPFFSVFRSTGDKTIDSQARKFMAENIETSLMPYLRSDQYKSATREGQFGELKNRLSELQTQAKNIAIQQSIQDYYSREQVPPIEQKKFEALPPKVRKATTDLYKDQLGRSLNEDTDFRKFGIALQLAKIVQKAPLAVQEDKPGFAVGGVVGKQALKKAGKSSVLNETMSLLQQVRKEAGVAVDAPVEQAAPSPVMDQTADMLMGKKPAPTKAAPKAITPPMPAAPKAVTAPTAAPTEQALPTPPAQVMETPTPSKAFADEDYIMGEEAMLDMYTPAQLKSWKVANPEDYENTLHSFTAQAKGLKSSEIPPPPFTKKTDESAESLVDEVEYDMDGNPVSVGGKAVVKKAEPIADEYGVDPKYLSGDVNSITGNVSVVARNKAVATIKETREDSFFKLRNNDKFASVDDDVLGVVLGDYRYSRGVELNPKDPAMLADAVKMAGQYQKRLETLREKYKDVPPVKLFHGQGVTEDVATLKKSGFTDPSKRDEFFHSEMMVGAPSFTKDLNLGFRGTPFGGTKPENYVVTEIPYADYVFNKINMAPEKYDRKDMNTILRAVTGAPGVVRPIGLPRAGFLETEDMMLEAEKLRVKGANAKLRSGEKDVAQVLGAGGKGLSRATMKGEEETVSEYMKLARTTPNPKEKMKLAYMSYTGIKDLMNSYLDMATATSTKSGLGQQYQAAINNFADYSGIQRQMREVGDILWDGGAKQKAQNLYDLSDKLKKFQQSEPAISKATDEAKRTKPLDEVRKFVPKLAKGGLASRR
jgi:uncharacterized protein YoaH (UPF0181 family)